MLFSSKVRTGVRIRVSVWLVNGYAHVFIVFFLFILCRVPCFFAFIFCKSGTESFQSVLDLPVLMAPTHGGMARLSGPG